MKTTPFTRYHVENGARMAEFAGYHMPIEFTGINDEHCAVRERAGVFDVSHMGEIWVKGPRAAEFLQYVTTNDIRALRDGKVQYSCLPNGRGGIVDDILIYRIDAGTFLLVVNASNVGKDWSHLVAQGEKFEMRPGSFTTLRTRSRSLPCRGRWRCGSCSGCVRNGSRISNIIRS